MCRSAESVAWTVHVKLTSLPSHLSSADFTTFDGQSLTLLQLFLDICELPVMHFIWGLFGLSLVQYLLTSHEVLRSPTLMICTQVCLKHDNYP